MSSPDRGIVRPARRPATWSPPGPPPVAPRDRPDAWPGKGEDLCHLAGDWRILQRIRGHRWSLDDLVTAWVAAEVAAPRPPSRIADLGCGIGAVLLLLAWRFPAARVTGVEAQESSAALARRSLAWNGVEGRCEVRLGDFRDTALTPEGAIYDLVTGTPPYLPLGTGAIPQRTQQEACHLEMRGGIEEYCTAAARLVDPEAAFVVCHAAAQTARVESAAQDAGLWIERRLDVVPREGKAPLFAVYAMRCRPAPDGQLVFPPLVVRDASGRRTAAFCALRAAMGMPP